MFKTLQVFVDGQMITLLDWGTGHEQTFRVENDGMHWALSLQAARIQSDRNSRTIIVQRSL